LFESFFIFDAKQSHKNYKLFNNSVSSIPKVSIHVPICREPVEMVRETLIALSQLDYPDYEVCVIVNNTTEDAFTESWNFCYRIDSSKKIHCDNRYY